MFYRVLFEVSIYKIYLWYLIVVFFFFYLHLGFSLERYRQQAGETIEREVTPKAFLLIGCLLSKNEQIAGKNSKNQVLQG